MESGITMLNLLYLALSIFSVLAVTLYWYTTKKQIKLLFNLNNKQKLTYNNLLSVFRLLKKFSNAFLHEFIPCKENIKNIFDMLDNSNINIKNFVFEINKICKELEIDISQFYSPELFLKDFIMKISYKFCGFNYKINFYNEAYIEELFLKNFILFLNKKRKVHSSDAHFDFTVEELINLKESDLGRKLFLHIPKVLFLNMNPKMCNIINFKEGNKYFITVLMPERNLSYILTGALLTDDDKIYSITNDTGSWEVYDGNKKIYFDNKKPVKLRYERFKESDSSDSCY